jgi:DNA repair exonuclease SbcCD ATPase subunit
MISRTGLSLSSPEKTETKTKLHVQDLRQVLSERMVEFRELQSRWHSERERLQGECERMASDLRNIDMQAAASGDAEKKKHLLGLAQLNDDHKNVLHDLQTKIQDALTGDDSKLDDELDQEIAALEREISSLDDELRPQEDVELVDADEHWQRLNDQWDTMQQRHEEALHQKEEESQKHTQMVEQLLVKQMADEEAHAEKVAEFIQNLNALDQQRMQMIAEVQQEIANERARILAFVRAVSVKVQAIQQAITKKQRDHAKTIRELQDKADRLRTTLEARTARQEQQMAEARTCARKIADEKRKFASMSHEFQMLNAERVRETVDHGTLMRELSKMDGFILAQMSSGKRGSSFAARSRRF